MVSSSARAPSGLFVDWSGRDGDGADSLLLPQRAPLSEFISVAWSSRDCVLAMSWEEFVGERSCEMGAESDVVVGSSMSAQRR